jgi:hypothetical protein
MGFESRIFISAEQFAMNRSNSSAVIQVSNGEEDRASTTPSLMKSQDSSSGCGGDVQDLARSVSPVKDRGAATVASNYRRPSGRRNWSDDNDEHAPAPAPAHAPAHAPAEDEPFENLDDPDEAKARLFTEILENLPGKSLNAYAHILSCLNSLLQLHPLLTKAGFDDREILRFFRLVIKVFSPNPPKRSKVPRKQKAPKKVPEGSTSRLEIMMKIFMKTGVRNFQFDAMKVIRGIVFSTVNPMLVALIVECIHAAEDFSNIAMKRMYLFLVALASGISCDSPVVKEPLLLSKFFTNVITAVISGMPECRIQFDREQVLPADNFSKEFADAAMRVLNYVDNVFSKVLNEVAAEADASSKKPSKKQQPAKGAAIGDDPEANPFDGFDDEILDSMTMTTVAGDAIDREKLSPFFAFLLDCFNHALDLVCKDDSEIMGLTSEHSLRFVMLSLTSAALKPSAAIAFDRFGALCSMIKTVGPTKFSISHDGSADFISQYACMVRLWLPAIDQDDRQAAEKFLLTCFSKDMRSFASRMSLPSVMQKLYGLFRHNLLANKKKLLDATFTDVFPKTKLPESPEPAKAAVQLPKSTRFMAVGGGAAADDEEVVVNLVDIGAAEFRAFQEWRRQRSKE